MKNRIKKEYCRGLNEMTDTKVAATNMREPKERK